MNEHPDRDETPSASTQQERPKGPSAAMNEEEMQQQYRIQQSRMRCVGCGEGEEFF